MTEKYKKAFALLTAAAMSCALGGCGEEKPESINRAEFMATLPSVTAFSLEAERIRAEQTDTLHEETVQEAVPPEETSPSETALQETSDEETVTSVPGETETDGEPEDETWKEGLSFPEIADLDREETAGSETAEETNFLPTESAVTTQQSAPADTAPVQTIAAVSETSGASETIAVSPASAENAALGLSGTVSAPSQEYDEEFFSSDLFIGDSISTGYSLYGFMDEKNVFAKIGLNPSSVMTKSVPTVYGDITVTDMISLLSPKRVYIMLGSNGIQWLSTDSMLRSMRSLTEMISLTSPGTEIVIVGVPPVTAAYDSTVDGLDVMAAVNEYNSGLSEFAAECGFIYVDPGEILKDSTGYFSGSYAENDGMHFKSATYKILLSFIQTKVTQAEQEAAPAAAGGSEAIAELADKLGVDDTIKNAVTGMPTEFVTLPEETTPDSTPAEAVAGGKGEPDVWDVSDEKIKE